MVLGVRRREVRRKYHDLLSYKIFALQMERGNAGRIGTERTKFLFREVILWILR